jgi:GH25 family lysozyme M1 (1,4-beta-N-acetylmuramidase)
MSLARGLELAIYQPHVDWPTLIQATGISFVFVKGSDGSSPDPLFANHWAEAKNAGMLRGAYHFLRETPDPQQQVDTYMQVLGADTGELPPVLDIEVPAMKVAAKVAAAAQFWLSAVESQVHRRPIIYTAGWWWDPNMLINGSYPTWAPGYRLWVANWPLIHSVPTADQLNQGQLTPVLPKSWTNWMFWQYSGDLAEVAGITGDGGTSVKVDLDVFNGTADDLQAVAQAVPVNPAAKPQDKASDPVVAAVLKLPDPRVTNQVLINAFSHAFGTGYWDVVTRAGLAGIADQRQAEYAGPMIQALANLTAAEQAALQQQLIRIVGG